jgi:hypothetical protein
MSSSPTFQGDELPLGNGLPLLYNLVYCSRANPGMDKAEVERIVKSAKRWNPVHGITGLLVFGGGIFFQWLEGPRDSVMGLMRILAADPRHESIVSLTESEEVRERMFPDWDMELVTPDDIRDVLADALGEATDPKHSAALKLLLEQLDSGHLGELGHA